MLVSVLFALCIYPIRCHEEEIQGLEAKIVNGILSNIKDFPYVAYLGIAFTSGSAYCGASILNQYIVMSAGHCITDCYYYPCKILVRCGSTHKDEGTVYFVNKFVVHPSYMNSPYGIGPQNDIALLKVKNPIQFCEHVSRVAVMQSPPYKEPAIVAGWGRINEERLISSVWLRHITQRITRRIPCETAIGDLPLGVFCGSAMNKTSYASLGDSGSALVVQGYIQVGVVSFKRIDWSRSIVVYTDVGYFFPWIEQYTLKLLCD